MKPKLSIKRVYDAPAPADGRRILVERLWPRGIKKADLELHAWFRDLAPTKSLRRWFAHDPAKWPEFQRRYRTELNQNPDLVHELLNTAAKTRVTLLFSSRDTEHNNVIALHAYLLDVWKNNTPPEAHEP